MPAWYYTSIMNMGLRLPDKLHEALREIAHRERTSINKLVIAAIGADEEVRREVERQAQAKT